MQRYKMMLGCISRHPELNLLWRQIQILKKVVYMHPADSMSEKMAANLESQRQILRQALRDYEKRQGLTSPYKEYSEEDKCRRSTIHYLRDIINPLGGAIKYRTKKSTEVILISIFMK